MSIEVIPTGAALGAEIRGVNLAQPLDDATFAAVENAYNTRGVIFFRDQGLTPSQQVAFTRWSFQCFDHGIDWVPFGRRITLDHVVRLRPIGSVIAASVEALRSCFEAAI